MSKASDLLRKVQRRAFKAKARLGIVAWLAKNQMIPSGIGSPEEGKRFSPESIPWMNAWLERYENPRVREISIMAAVRSGKTMFQNLTIPWVMAEDPGWILNVAFSTDMAQKWSRDEVDPLIMNCPPARKVARITKEDWKNLEKRFEGGKINFVGAGSPGKLAGFQARYLNQGEIDKWPFDLGTEAGPLKLSEQRTALFEFDKKITRSSTPNLSGQISFYFHKGTQEYCYLPCPICQHKQRLTFFRENRIGPDGKIMRDEKGNNLKTGCMMFGHLKEPDGSYDPERVQRETAYECEKCSVFIPQKWRNWMFARYDWRSHNPKVSIVQSSFHIWKAYSPWVSWGSISNEWLAAKGNAGFEMDFYNSTLGLMYQLKKSETKAEDILNVVRTTPIKYRRGRIPFRMERKGKAQGALVLSIDTQSAENGFWWLVAAVDSRGALWLIDWGQAWSFDELEDIAEREYSDGTESYMVAECAIDAMGTRTKDVYDWCVRMYPLAKPFQGKGEGQKLKDGQALRPIQFSKLEEPWAILQLHQFHDFLWKVELYVKAILARTGKGFFLPELESIDGKGDGVDQLLIGQLTDEKLQGDGTWKAKGWNHLGDCCKMALVQATLLSARLEAEAEEDGEPEEKEKAA